MRGNCALIYLDVSSTRSKAKNTAILRLEVSHPNTVAYRDENDVEAASNAKNATGSDQSEVKKRLRATPCTRKKIRESKDF
jgi:hypothetical protein